MFVGMFSGTFPAIPLQEATELIKDKLVNNVQIGLAGSAINDLLLNVVKNKRRTKLAQILIERPLSLDEIQQRLKGEGYYHSRDTIRKDHAGPMVAAKLLVEENGRYGLTDEGRSIMAILGDTDLGAIFPASSGCYEEKCLLALEVPRNYDDLSRYLQRVGLQRTIRRLRGKGL